MADDRGLYIVWLEMEEGVTIRVGALGALAFQPGLYAYVGSAQRGRDARIARHLRKEKPLRWHIDYIRPHGTIVGVTLIDGSREDECRLAESLARSAGARRAHPRFGASDCGCGGHLIAFPPEASTRPLL